MRRHALVAGSTGLVGRRLLQCLLDDAAFESVVALTRRPLAIPHPKLVEALIDFEHLPEFALPAIDDYFCCLGTTIRKAGSQQAFREVDLVYPLELARMALAAGATRCFLVSAMGADPHSRVFYSRVKGELEAELARLSFGTLVVLRPSLLDGPREEFRLGERAALAVLRPLAALLPARHRPVSADVVAHALVGAAHLAPPGRTILESDVLPRLAAEGMEAMG
jgi:uncharacterized protein YbjT (DUF2867 family)